MLDGGKDRLHYGAVCPGGAKTILETVRVRPYLQRETWLMLSLSRLPAEFRLVCQAVAALVPARPEEQARRCRALRQDWQEGAFPGLDWSLVIRLAMTHRVLRCLARVTADWTAIPPRAAAQLQRQEQRLLHRSLLLAREAIRLNGLFRQAGLPALFVKGVVLSQQLFDDLAWRGPGDLDMLVAPENYVAAWQVLQEAGYRPDGEAVAPAAVWSQRDRAFTHPQWQTHVELHQRLTASPSLFPQSFASLWEQRQLVLLAGSQLPTLPAVANGLYLALHGYLHCWERLCWLADLARLSQNREQTEEWMEQATAAGMAEAMRCGLDLASHWLALPEEGESLPVLARGRKRTQRFVRWFVEDGSWQAPPVRGERRWLRRHLRQRWNRYCLPAGWRRRWAEVRADLFNPVDHDLFHLPPSLWWLYPFLRPAGWVLRNFRHD